MKTPDLSDLWGTVELARQQLHPDLDPTFLRAIVRIEHDHLEDDAKALKLVAAALNDVASTKKAS